MSGESARSCIAGVCITQIRRCVLSWLATPRRKSMLKILPSHSNGGGDFFQGRCIHLLDRCTSEIGATRFQHLCCTPVGIFCPARFEASESLLQFSSLNDEIGCSIVVRIWASIPKSSISALLVSIFRCCMDVCKWARTSLDANGHPRISMDIHGYPILSMDTHGFP